MEQLLGHQLPTLVWSRSRAARTPSSGCTRTKRPCRYSNTALAAPNAHPSNGDAFSCNLVGPDLRTAGFEFLASLGGAENFIETPEPDQLPCQGDEITREAMDPVLQNELLVTTAAAFFSAHLAKSADVRLDACRFLLHELPKHPAVKLE